MKNKVQRTVVSALTASAMAVVSLATPASASPHKNAAASSVAGDTFALVNGDNADPFFLTIWKGALAEAKKFHVHLVEVAPTTFDYTTQLPLLYDEIAKKVNGIILSPDGDTQLDPGLAKAHAAGIPVVLVNSDSTFNSNPNKIGAFTSNQILLGQLAAKAMGSLIHGHGTVAVINSVAGALGDEQRGSAFIATMHKYFPNVKTLPEQYDLDSRTTAEGLANDFMEAYPNLTGIYGVDSFTGQGVGTAIKDDHKVGKIKLVAIDAEPQEVALLREGVAQALIAQQPYGMGTGAVQALVAYLTGHKSQVKNSVILPPIEVTAHNINTPAIQKVVYASKP